MCQKCVSPTGDKKAKVRLRESCALHVLLKYFTITMNMYSNTMSSKHFF
jgi:hypothetical protein